MMYVADLECYHVSDGYLNYGEILKRVLATIGMLVRVENEDKD